MATRRKRRVRDDSTKSFGQITRRWVKKKPGGRALIAVVDTPKKIKRAVKKIQKGR